MGKENENFSALKTDHHPLQLLYILGLCHSQEAFSAVNIFQIVATQ